MSDVDSFDPRDKAEAEVQLDRMSAEQAISTAQEPAFLETLLVVQAMLKIYIFLSS